MESLFCKQITPDVEELINIINRTSLPKRVHFIELGVDTFFLNYFCDNYELDKDIDRQSPFAEAKRLINTYKFLGYDVFRFPVAIDCFPTQMRITKDTAQTGSEQQGNREWVEESAGPIQSWQDFENYPWPKIKDIDFAPLEWMEKNLPENMGCFDYTAHILEMTTNLLGYETFCLKLYDEPDLVDSVFEKVGKFYVKLTEAFCGFSCMKVIWGSDDMGFRTSTLVSAEILRKNVLPWHKKCAAIAHKNNRPYLLHSCGQLSEIIDDLIDDVGIDAKHSYEDAILPVTEAKKIYGDSIAILGGMDVDFLCRSTEQQIRQRVRETLENCMPGGGYCLGTGNTVANYIPMENYFAMLDEGRKFSV